MREDNRSDRRITLDVFRAELHRAALAANGDSNDEEIEALQEAVACAYLLLGVDLGAIERDAYAAAHNKEN